jgi:hypothetical protein
MGFSDTGTYIRSVDMPAIWKSLEQILGEFGFKKDSMVTYNHVPSYHPIEETKDLTFWREAASDEFTRLYCSHSGVFAVHHGDYIPVLGKLAAALSTDAFEIAVNDGCSICVLETDGEDALLSGCHDYVQDEVYELTSDFKIEPGTILTLRGIKFPYQNVDVEAMLVPELIGYDFRVSSMDSAIRIFELNTFGKDLPSYYDSDPEKAGSGERGGFSRRK